MNNKTGKKGCQTHPYNVDGPMSQQPVSIPYSRPLGPAHLRHPFRRQQLNLPFENRKDFSESEQLFNCNNKKI